MANQYFYVRARRPRPNSAPERCLRDDTWTRVGTAVGGAHGWGAAPRESSRAARGRAQPETLAAAA